MQYWEPDSREFYGEDVSEDRMFDPDKEAIYEIVAFEMGDDDVPY